LLEIQLGEQKRAYIEMLLCEDATLVNCTSSTTPWVGVVANLDSILKISMEFEMQRRNTEKEKE